MAPSVIQFTLWSARLKFRRVHHPCIHEGYVLVKGRGHGAFASLGIADGKSHGILHAVT